jgi:hypothetical protein
MWAMLKLFSRMSFYFPEEDRNDPDARIKAIIFAIDDETLEMFSTRKNLKC